MTHELVNLIFVQLRGHQCFDDQGRGCQSGVRSCTIPGFSTHLAHALNIDTVVNNHYCER